jgi:hypothetical protein
MLDDLLELFERDRKPGTQSKSGLRGRLSSLLGDDDRQASPDRDRRSHDEREDDDDDRRSGRKRSHERDFFEFGD